MNVFNKYLEKIVYFAFLVPIITVAIVSISHVTSWYGLTNNPTWSIYLSFGVEIAALAALAAISVQMGKKVYLPFGIVTLIQFVGNVFYSYQYIDESSKEFKDWVELSNVFFQYIIDDTDIVGHKRLLALFSGGLLPIISLSFLHMIVKFREKNAEVGDDEQIDPQPNDEIITDDKRSDEYLNKLEEYLDNVIEPENENKVRGKKLDPKTFSTETIKFPVPTPTISLTPKTKRVRKPRIPKEINLEEIAPSDEAIKTLRYRKRDGADN
jgi:hypothetical protein